MKNHDNFCALNQDLPTIRPINYQKSSSVKTFLSSPMLSTKISIKPNLFQPYLWHIHFFFFFKTVNSADYCVLKYHPKHADSTKNYPLIQSLFFLIVDIVKFAVTFGLTSRMVTIRAQAHLTNETSRWQKREKLCRAIQCKKLHQRSCHEARNQPKYDLWLRTVGY